MTRSPDVEDPLAQAAIDGARGERDTKVALDELRERYPFFAMWWRDEAAELLVRSR